MLVRVHRGQLNYFRRKALLSVPKEIFAELLGKQVSKNIIDVHRFAYPKLKISTPGAVEPDEDSLNQIHEQARHDGLEVVGDIHTHPNWPPIMSPADHHSHVNCGNMVTGIVEVTNGRTRVVFWRHDSSLRCDLKYL